MDVKLIGYTAPVNGGNPASIVELAASQCYNSTPTKSFAIAKACAKSGHMSVWEHINFVFELHGVSRAFLAQITRHRHFSFSVRSQRYCDEDGFEYEVPHLFFSNSAQIEEFVSAMEAANESYKKLKDLGAANEDARAVLPNACYTKMVISANARSWIESSYLRLCARAQYEIRQFYMKVKSEIATVCPEVSALMVPKCETHKIPFCEEGRCCGRHDRLDTLYCRGDDLK